VNLDKIRKLLALAEKNTEGKEGKSAKKRALHALDKLGLTEADVAMTEIVLLTRARTLWEEALADVLNNVHPTDLFERIEKKEGTNRVLVRGSAADAELVAHRFKTLRRAVLLASGKYHRKLMPYIGPRQIPILVNTFCNYAVIALGERILDDDIEDEEIERLETPPTPAQEPSRNKNDWDYQEEKYTASFNDEKKDDDEAEGYFDKLLKAVDKAPELGFKVPHLDPMLCGYTDGQQVVLVNVIPCETTETHEEARLQLTQRKSTPPVPCGHRHGRYGCTATWCGYGAGGPGAPDRGMGQWVKHCREMTDAENEPESTSKTSKMNRPSWWPPEHT